MFRPDDATYFTSRNRRGAMRERRPCKRCLHEKYQTREMIVCAIRHTSYDERA
jgi:hypothetical protein